VSFAVLLFAEVSLQQEVIHHYVHLVTTCLAWSHSCWNPLLYMLVQEDVKKQVCFALGTSKG